MNQSEIIKDPVNKWIKKAENSFTTMELLVVLAIMSTLSITAIPAFVDFLGNSKLKGAALEIAAACKTARQLAIANRKNYRIIFVTSPDTVNNLYYAVKIYQDKDMTVENWRQLVSSVQIYSDSLTSLVNVPYPDDNGSLLSKPNIEFFPDGHASDNCHIGLKETAKPATENSMVINIYNTTGAVRIR